MAEESDLAELLMKEVQFFKKQKLKIRDVKEVSSALKYIEMSAGSYVCHYADLGEIWYCLLAGNV